MKRVFFFLNLLVKRTKLFAHDWSSVCLATGCVFENLFHCKNGLRFDIVDEEYIEELKNERK